MNRVSGNVVPMVHVPDVAATVTWYREIGFTVARTHSDHGVMTWALVTLGEGSVMFTSPGTVSMEWRREMDLYVNTEGVDDLHDRLKDRVDVVEAPHDTDYGMRELIIRDLNRFWITFGEVIEG